jgi:tetratricopeptide (TPR) repeat protein
MRVVLLWARYWLLWAFSYLRIGAASMLYRLAVDAYRQDSRAVSERSLDRAIEVSRPGRKADLACDLGDFQFDLQDFEAAAVSYRRALEEDDHHAPALRGTGLSLHAMGAGSEAVYYYVSLLQQDPEDVDVILNLALVLIWSGRLEDAEELIEQAEAVVPGSADTLEVRAEMAYAKGEIDEGITILADVVERFPERCEPRRVLGIYLHAVGRMEEAGVQFQGALECDPDDPRLLMALTGYNKDLGNGAAVVQYARRAVDILTERIAPADDLATAYWHLAWGHYMLGELQDSIAAGQEGVRTAPSLWGVRADLALAQLCAGDTEAAETNYQLVVQMAMDAGELRMIAVEDLQEAISTRPDLDHDAATRMLNLLQARERALDAETATTR